MHGANRFGRVLESSVRTVFEVLARRAPRYCDSRSFLPDCSPTVASTSRFVGLFYVRFQTRSNCFGAAKCGDVCDIWLAETGLDNASYC